MNILLDYFFPITSIEPTPQASTAFLKQVCVVVKPLGETPTGVITACTTMAAVGALTANTEAQQLFNAGMNKVYILPMDDLDLEDALEGQQEFFTVLISSDFNDDDVLNLIDTAAVKSSLKVQDILYEAVTEGVAGDSISITYTDDGSAGSETVDVDGNDIEVHMEAGVSTAQQIADAIEASGPASALVTVTVDSGDEDDVQAAFATDNLEGGVDEVVGDPEAGLLLGTFKGVTGVSSIDDSFLGDQAVIERRAAFHTTSGNKAKNMFYAFGKLLANPLNWLNQQYITMPFADDVSTLGAANSLFDDKVSFVLNDDQYGKRLALFAAGAKAIIAPYIKRNLEIDLQSAALSYISGNQPQYTVKHATLLEDALQKVIDGYITREWIEDGTVQVKLENDNFVASGYINISEPSALWRIFGELRQTL